MSRTPLVVITCNRHLDGDYPFHRAGERYAEAIRHVAGAMPLLLPMIDPPVAPAEILARADGILFSGGVSNIAPHRYGGAPPRPGVLQDHRRDATVFPLIDAALALGKPALFICRGFQELNVALGGTLHQHLHEVPGRLDHRERDADPLEVQYGPAHDIDIAATGLLARLTPQRRVMVNSVHGQGIDRLADALHADAHAPDGQIEAVSMPSAPGFVFGAQWHPEWHWRKDALSRAIFGAFGDAIRG